MARHGSSRHWGWPGVGVGRFWKRCYHKAQRQWVRGHGGSERSVTHYGSTVNWKTW